MKQSLIRGWWVVDADIQSYFDTIDHDLLLSLVERRISDRRVLKLIRQRLTMCGEVYDALIARVNGALDYDVRWQPNEYEPDGYVERVQPLELTNGNHAQGGCPTCGARIYANRTEVMCACGQPVSLI